MENDDTDFKQNRGDDGNNNNKMAYGENKLKFYYTQTITMSNGDN